MKDARTRLDDMDAVQRLAARDATMFSDPGLASQRLGWVGLPAEAAARSGEYGSLARDVAAAGITDVVLLGMGGSSLAPLVLSRSIPRAAGSPRLHVLDTTSPAAARHLLDALVPAATLVVVSSKSGGSVEPLALAAVFGEWLEASLGDGAADHLLAITDPGSPLEDLARRGGWRPTILAPADVGGRYSALSPFALVPAALAGIDVARLASAAETMEATCARASDDDPALALASVLADALDAGRDKLHIVCADGVRSFGLWAEQLVAESTGKDGRGMLPVLAEDPGAPVAHGPDAVTFVLRTEGDEALAAFASGLPEGEPVFEVVIDDPYALAAEFVHWEWAVALMCAVEGIECFGQPDVESAKAKTLAILAGEEPPLASSPLAGGIRLAASAGIPLAGVRDALAGLLAHLPDRGYLAVLAYLPEDEPALASLREACATLSAGLRVPVTLEIGPRYLHSTGQYHKGGPASGAFLVLTVRDEVDVAIPDRPFTLGELFAAQAAGDAAALCDAGQPVLSVDLPRTESILELARDLARAERA